MEANPTPVPKPVWFWNEDIQAWVEGRADFDEPDDKWIVKVTEGDREREMTFDKDAARLDIEMNSDSLPEDGPISEDGEEILLYKRNEGEILTLDDPRERVEKIAGLILDTEVLFRKFSVSILDREENEVKKALTLMFPISMSKYRQEIVRLLGTHTRKPHDYRRTATLALDEQEGHTYAGKHLQGTTGAYDRGYASSIKHNTGMLFSVENGTFKAGQTIYKFYELNNPFFNAFVGAEKNFSEGMAKAAVALLNSANPEAQPRAQPPLQPQAEWNLITFRDNSGREIQLPYIEVDDAGLEFISQYTNFIIADTFEEMNKIIKEVSVMTAKYTIRIGQVTIKVSVYTLLWLTKYLYDKLTQESWWLGSILSWVTRTLFDNKEFLFGGPFQNFSNPEPVETQIRRANRIVFTFFYTMIDILIYIKGKASIPQYLPDKEGFSSFIAREASTWTLEEIFEYGPAMYDAVMRNKSFSEDYHNLYDKSIRIVTSMLDKRIFDASIKIETLKTALTPLATTQKAPPISEANQEQIKLIKDAIHELIELGGMTDDFRLVLVAGGWLDAGDASQAGSPDDDSPASQAGSESGSEFSQTQGFTDNSQDMAMAGGARKKSSKKRTKKKSKKKSGKRKKAGKRKKSSKHMRASKRKKTKRKSMKQVKEKLINLINSL